MKMWSVEKKVQFFLFFPPMLIFQLSSQIQFANFDFDELRSNMAASFINTKLMTLFIAYFVWFGIIKISHKVDVM